MGEVMVAVEDPDFAGSSTEVAVIDTVGGLGTPAGAVYIPVPSIVPQVAPAQPAPLTPQVTLESIAFCTLTVNCCAAPMFTAGFGGDTVKMTAASMETVAASDFVVSAAEVAFTVTDSGVGTFAGAVYNPVLLMVPQPAPLHPVPESVQVTFLLVEFVIVAVNCFVFVT